MDLVGTSFIAGLAIGAFAGVAFCVSGVKAWRRNEIKAGLFEQDGKAYKIEEVKPGWQK